MRGFSFAVNSAVDELATASIDFYLVGKVLRDRRSSGVRWIFDEFRRSIGLPLELLQSAGSHPEREDDWALPL